MISVQGAGETCSTLPTCERNGVTSQILSAIATFERRRLRYQSFPQISTAQIVIPVTHNLY